MKQNIIPAIRLTLVCVFVFMIAYPLLILGVAQFAPNKGKGLTITLDGRSYHAIVGQTFTDDKYFWSRPSAVGYNAAGSGGSNKGPSNPDYLAEVQGRIDSFITHNPGVEKSEIPSDLVTASGSGLDPHISVQAADVQVKRIAHVRNMPESQIKELVKGNTESPFAGLFGTERINVLKLNLALDAMNK